MVRPNFVMLVQVSTRRQGHLLFLLSNICFDEFNGLPMS